MHMKIKFKAYKIYWVGPKYFMEEFIEVYCKASNVMEVVYIWQLFYIIIYKIYYKIFDWFYFIFYNSFVFYQFFQ